MTIAVILIAPPGSRTEEIMSLVNKSLELSGKKSKLLLSHTEMYSKYIFNFDYIIVGYPLHNWRYFNSYLNRFDDVKFISHAPLWKGKTHRGDVEIVDSNWSTWCIRNLMNSGMNLKLAKSNVADLSRSIPSMIKYYDAILIENRSITDLTTSVHIGKADSDEITTVGNSIQNLVLSDKNIAKKIIRML